MSKKLKRAISYDCSGRESMKWTASELQSSGDINGLRGLVMSISHWLRNADHGITFLEYVPHWAHAMSRSDIDHIADCALPLLKHYPLKGPCHIIDGCTDWNKEPITI